MTRFAALGDSITVGWMAPKGTAWLVRRSRDLVPALAGLALREWLGIGH